VDDQDTAAVFEVLKNTKITDCEPGAGERAWTDLLQSKRKGSELHR